MHNNVQDADNELHHRYQRAAKQLEPWRIAIDSIADDDQRRQAIGRYEKIERLAKYVAERLGELKFARDNGLDYLCRDAAKKVDEFEREIMGLRSEYRNESPASTDPDSPGSPSRASVLQEMRAASCVSASLAPPSSPTTPGRSSVIQEMRARANTGSVQVSAPRYAEVVKEVDQWGETMEKLSRKIHHHERNLPTGISPVEARRRIADLQSKHRRAAEKIGRCRGWVRTGATRLATTTDWQRDFEIAREGVANLEAELLQFVESSNSRTQPPAPPAKPEIKTVPIGRANRSRIRPGIGLAASVESDN